MKQVDEISDCEVQTVVKLNLLARGRLEWFSKS